MNYTSRYVRLFPVNFQNDEHELTSILEQINEISLCYYYWNSDHSYLDILYTSKHLIDYFLNDSVLEKFHYWEIGADEGYDHDTITGRSKFYKTKVGQSVFNYSSISYYQADQIRFSGFSNDFKNYVKVIFKDAYEVAFNDTKNIYIRDEKLIYSATNDRWSTISSLDNNKNEDVENRLFKDGFILDLIEVSRYGTERLNVLDFVFNEAQKNGNDFIKSIELMNNGRVVHKFSWNQEAKRWSSLHGDFWSNCIDTEYIRFIEWYKKEKDS
ncbi:hypothetical protein ACFSTE_22525 [Aquimarina hainanensis]|uniref:Uncharacterized protein n=1 Tax=Aquimarina hainanensis TaxID=1578017 RepID=A0ABW5NET7_9FLAO